VSIRLTESRLRQIIREEASSLLRNSRLREGRQVIREYEEYLVRRGNKTFRGNDEGGAKDEEYYDDDPESHGLYDDGQTAPLESSPYGSRPLGGRQRRWTSY